MEPEPNHADRSQHPLVVASNRLPFLLRSDEGGWRVKPASGGLVTAVDPLMRRKGGVWVGWPGVTDDVPELTRLLKREGGSLAYGIEPVALSPGEKRDFYEGFSNELIWPLFHGFPGACRFEPRLWQSYQEVNDNERKTTP